MARINATELYQQIKLGKKYVEELHCPMIIKTMYELGTVSGFCKTAGISDSTFYDWVIKYKLFNECYRAGRMLALEAWEEEGREAKGDPEFNLELWRTQGASRHGVGKTGRIRVHIDAKATPYIQYQQLLGQASLGEFTASELKQVMESLNIGLRTYETFELQREVDLMKEDLTKMNQNHGHNIVPIAPITKAN